MLFAHLMLHTAHVLHPKLAFICTEEKNPQRIRNSAVVSHVLLICTPLPNQMRQPFMLCAHKHLAIVLPQVWSKILFPKSIAK